MPRHQLGEEQVTINDNFKCSATRFNQFHVGTEFILQPGRQTGGERAVISLGTVFNLNFHSFSF